MIVAEDPVTDVAISIYRIQSVTGTRQTTKIEKQPGDIRVITITQESKSDDAGP